MDRDLFASDHNPRHPIRTPIAVTVHGLDRRIASRLTDDDTDVTVAARTCSG
jgi:hypothetical protein